MLNSEKNIAYNKILTILKKINTKKKIIHNLQNKNESGMHNKLVWYQSLVAFTNLEISGRMLDNTNRFSSIFFIYLSIKTLTPQTYAHLVVLTVNSNKIPSKICDANSMSTDRLRRKWNVFL